MSRWIATLHVFSHGMIVYDANLIYDGSRGRFLLRLVRPLPNYQLNHPDAFYPMQSINHANGIFSRLSCGCWLASRSLR